MKEVDYIVVGLGIAGVSFCDRLIRSQKDFVALDVPNTSATRVAGGIVNPVVLKRITPVWNAIPFLEEANSFYASIQTRLQSQFLKETEILRILAGAEEQNEWMIASGKNNLAGFLTSKLKPNTYASLQAPYELGKMNRALQIDTKLLLDNYADFLMESGKYSPQEFQYDQLTLEGNRIRYGDIVAKQIVFAEGAAVVENPYFTIEGLIPKKGEYITIKAEKLQLDKVVKGPFFLIPLGSDLYKVGATFAHGDVSPEQTLKGREQLIAALHKMIDCPFQVVAQEVGMRPTVKDRKPLLGSLSHKQLYFFNGLGTRGLLMAPLLSKMLFDHIEKNQGLPLEMDIKRFSSDRT
ncbi:MAG: FAD-dependent oxidoreductase [Aureisphaera sp.]